MIGTTLGQAFAKAAFLWPDKVAIQDLRTELTYRELDAQSTSLAHTFAGLGIGYGDRVSVWMQNRVEYVVTELALLKLGALRVPMNQLVSDEEAQRRLDFTGAKIVVCGPEFLARANTIRAHLPQQPRIVAVGVEGAMPQDALAWAALLAERHAGPVTSPVGPEDPAAIMFTGGTTGQSKGIVHTHRTIMATTFSCILEWGLRPEDVLLHATPLPHGAGFMAFAGLVRGCRNVLLDKFTPDGFLQTVAREKVSWTFLVPTMLYTTLDSGMLPRYDVSSLTSILYGAAPMAPARVAEALRAFGPVLVQAYAQMEAINSGTLLSKTDHVEALKGAPERLASCGRPGLMPSIRIVNADMQDVAAGEVGEISIKSPHVMKEYWRDPEATARAVRDGWLLTGDLARQDERGYVYIVDRTKDIIISGGMNVYSSMVEAALFAHPAIATAAVFAVPDDKWGEAVRAHVVLRQGCSATEDELTSHCRAHLSRYEVPKQIAIVDALPMTPYGKIDKKVLRRPFWAGTSRNVG